MTTTMGTLWQPNKTRFYGTLEDRSVEPAAQGGFGLIYKAIWKLGPRSGAVAIKVPRSEKELQQKVGQGTPEVSTSYVLSHIAREVATWGRLRHTFIAPLIAYSTDATPTLIMPWYRNGDFWAFTQRDDRPETKLRLLQQVAEALDFLHSRQPPMIHCDIKPENILIDDTKNARLSNFGLSRYVLGVAEDFNLGTRGVHGIGTAEYMAPELAMGESPSVRTDVFAFGCLIVMAFCYTTPVKAYNADRLTFHLAQGNILSKNEFRGVPEALRGIAEECMHVDPSQRATMERVASRLNYIQL